MPRKVSSLVGSAGSAEPAAAIAGRARAAASDDERQSILVEGLLAYGADFPEQLAELDADLEEETYSLLGRWLGGETLTERADEAELRLHAGEQLLEEATESPLPDLPEADDAAGVERVTAELAESAEPMILQLAAVPIASLPAGHPDRDTFRARIYLLAAHRSAVARGDRELQLLPITALLAHDLVDGDTGESFVDEGLELLDDADDQARAEFLIEAESFAHGQAIDRRDEGDDAEAARWMERVDSLVAAQYGDEADSPAALVSRASQHDQRNEFREAAELYGRALASVSPDDPTTWPLAVRHGEVLLQVDEPEQAAEAIAPALDGLAQSYVTAVLAEQIEDAGDWLTRGAAALAVAHAASERPDAALEAIDRAKSVRLRYQAAVRQTPEADDLLALERALDAARRGVEVAELAELADGTEEGVADVQTRVLEAYRRTRPRLPAELLRSPPASELAALLEPHEALVVLGLHWKGTLVAAASGSTVDATVFGDWPTRRWMDLFTGVEGDGWLAALSGDSEDRSHALAVFLEIVDQLGEGIAGLLPGDVRRIVLVPHALLHLVPFWALQSLASLDVLVAPSAAQFAAARRLGPGRLEGQGLVVSNPTLDLPLSALEATSAREQLARLGVEARQLDGSDAVETAVAEALRSATLLHFTGHGQSDFAEPMRSGLLVHPSGNSSGEADPFASLLAGGLEWNDVDDSPDDERWADLPGVGRVYEIRNGLDEDRLERRLEQEGSTLVATYDGDRLIRAGELWSAGDLMLGDAASKCAFAFLSACESGMGSGRFVDEYGGVPAALELGGARTVVASMWPVSEPFTALYVELFYRELVRAGAGTVDLTAVVRSVRDRLSAMSRADALELVAELRRATDGIAARLTLDSFAAELRRRADPPFTELWELAAFFVGGNGAVTVGGSG
ncbi:MAG TPA: CHAT domain-containing protein [Gaiellaceae bacterium]